MLIRFIIRNDGELAGPTRQDVLGEKRRELVHSSTQLNEGQLISARDRGRAFSIALVGIESQRLDSERVRPLDASR